MAALGVVVVFIVTRRRHWWLRYTAAEEAFNIRIGIPKKWAAASRRFSESRKYIWFAWLVVVFFLVMAFLSGKLYLLAKHQLAITAPPEAKSFYDIGTEQKKAGNFSGAISNFNKAIEIFPNYVAAYNFRAQAKNKLEDYKGAVADADKAIELDSG